MQYGHFDNDRREYVIDRVDLPTSWTNYLGVDEMTAVVNHTAGGYLFYRSPESHRITRFRPNGVPMDRPGFYVYLRDNDSAQDAIDYWSISWQPVGKPLDKAAYRARHGLSYSVYECTYSGIEASQTLLVPRRDPVLIYDVVLRNTTDRSRSISVFSYLEFSFHQIEIDNQNFQMSLYCAGGSYADGIIEEDLFYEPDGYQYFTANFEPDGYDCVRDSFIGLYHTESDPLAVINGKCTSSEQKGGNHCGALQKDLALAPGEEVRLIYLVGEGDRKAGKAMREKYSDPAAVDAAKAALTDYWNERLLRLQIVTPDEGMNTLINTWTLYQSEINVKFSRFASFIEVGGRTGLGYRDTAQDAMTVPHSDPEVCRNRLVQLLRGESSEGFGLHLFQPEWFDPDYTAPDYVSPTIKNIPASATLISGLQGVCSDDALWLVPAVVEYIKETGDYSFADLQLTYADTYIKEHPERFGGAGTVVTAGKVAAPANAAAENIKENSSGSNAAFSGHLATPGDFTESVYDHLRRILDFSDRQTGADGICLGLRADWNDCLNLGGGESALVSFLHYWALGSFLELARVLKVAAQTDKSAISGTASHDFDADIAHYEALAEKVKAACDRELWDGGWYIRGITKNGKKIGTKTDTEGKVHLESNAWAVLSGAATGEKAAAALHAIDEYLYTPYGLRLNAPSFVTVNDDIGFVTRVYPGLKENGSVFSHPNPWAWAAACRIGRGDLAMKFYHALSPYEQNDQIEVRKAEPYSYCQFISGPDHTAFGEAHHPFMTGSGGWSYFSATRYILGIRPGFETLDIDPCIPGDWSGFDAVRVFRGSTYRIHVENPDGVMKGVKRIVLDGQQVNVIPADKEPREHTVLVTMG